MLIAFELNSLCGFYCPISSRFDRV